MRRLRPRTSGLVAAALFVSVSISSGARADGLYSVTDLGPAGPTANVTGQSQLGTGSGYPYLSGQNSFNSNGNYLTALSASSQAAFQAGSFDLYSHPSTAPYLYYSTPFYQNNGTYDVAFPNNISNGVDYLHGVSLTTSNNLGVTAGTGYENNSQGPASRLVLFTPDPHTVTSYPGLTAPQIVQSPGFMGVVHTSSDGSYFQFYGTPAGINDHNNIALTEYTYPFIAGSTQTILNPHLLSGGSDIALGSLGGSNGAAYALDNSNQIVGWSQIASGAAHAFLYSGGAMQDLNSLIPPSSGIVLMSAVGIDASREIVAFGADASGQPHEYLLTPAEAPVPEPTSLTMMSLMLAAVAARRAAARFKNTTRSTRSA